MAAEGEVLQKRILFHVLQLELALQDLRAADSLKKVSSKTSLFTSYGF